RSSHVDHQGTWCELHSTWRGGDSRLHMGKMAQSIFGVQFIFSCWTGARGCDRLLYFNIHFLLVAPMETYCRFFMDAISLDPSQSTTNRSYYIVLQASTRDDGQLDNR